MLATTLASSIFLYRTLFLGALSPLPHTVMNVQQSQALFPQCDYY